MNKIGILALAILLVSMFAPLAFALGPSQPPVDTTTIYVGTGAWGPVDADPAYAYDTASGEILFNVYDTLIQGGNATTGSAEPFWAFVPLLATSVPNQQMVTSSFAQSGLSLTAPIGFVFGTTNRIEGWVDNDGSGTVTVGDVFYIGEYPAAPTVPRDANTVRVWRITAMDGTTVSLARWYYNFPLRIGGSYPTINFYDNTKAVVDTFSTDDVVYTFQRAVVEDLDGSPIWMFDKPLFDVQITNLIPSVEADTVDGAWMLAKMIGNAFQDLGNNTVQINLGIPFPDTAFKQIISQTWGSILSKPWTIGKGAWDGNLFVADVDGFPDWFHTVKNVPPAFDTVAPANYAGTGPYIATVLDGSSLAVLDRNVNYWQGWPAGGAGSVTGAAPRKAFLEHVNIEYIGTWATRRDAFINAQLDVAAVSRSYIGQLLDSFGNPLYPNMITVKNVAPSLSMDGFFFVFNLAPTFAGVGTLGASPTGIPLDFFNNTHVRKAFAYAFNHTADIAQAWAGEALLTRETPGIFGLSPDYYTKGPNPPWTYDIGTGATPPGEASLIAELQAAMFTQGGVTKSVWDWGGFKVDLYYNTGNDPRRIGCEIIQAEFNRLNSVYGKSFQTTVVGLTWSNEINLLRQSLMPTFSIGWLADYADASNWYGPYMGSNGDFSGFSNYTEDNGWGGVGSRTGLNKDQILDLGPKTPDGPARAALYADLDDIYVATVPNYPTAQPLGRRWSQYWVKGWEYQALWPSQYYYHLYKENACWADVTGPTAGVPDGVTNMRDIGYVAAKFGAKAPSPPTYDPKWSPGSYGMAGADVYGDRKVDMRDIGFAASHFGHTTVP